MSLSIPTFQTTDNSDWETSFNQILNRTKNNLNRINQRYAPSPIENPIVTELPFASNISNINNININHNENTHNQRSSMEKKLANSISDTSSYLKSKVNYIDISLYERVARLEENQRSNDSSLIHRLTQLEKSMDTIHNTSDKATIEMKDVDRKVVQVQSKLNTMNGMMELLQNDNESKQLVISKMDSWIRQGEIWREEIDNKLEIINKQMKSLDRTRVEQRDMISEYVTKYDLDTLKDRMSVITQQTVAASLSAWHDKIESSVREVERQVALLRIGKTNSNNKTTINNNRFSTTTTSNNDNNNGSSSGSGSNYDDGDALLTPEEVQIALSTPLPSELLLKGTVAHEVLQMESKLEEKLQTRLQLYINNEFNHTTNKLNSNLNQKLYSLCTEMGIEYDSTTMATTAAAPSYSESESESFFPAKYSNLMTTADSKESSSNIPSTNSNYRNNKNNDYTSKAVSSSSAAANGFSANDDVIEQNSKRARENYRIRLLESKQ